MLSFKGFIRKQLREIINEQIELLTKHIQPCEVIIDRYLNHGFDVKIGKTSNIENRFDTSYTDKGYKELIKVYKCPNKRIMDELEEELIRRYDGKIENDQIGGGNKSYTRDYWIYIVIK